MVLRMMPDVTSFLAAEGGISPGNGVGGRGLSVVSTQVGTRTAGRRDMVIACWFRILQRISEIVFLLLFHEVIFGLRWPI